MNFSALQLAVVVSTPILLTAFVWRCCGSQMALSAVPGAFLLGALCVWPVIQFSNFFQGPSGGLSGHYYVDELLQMMVATAIPEEIGKGLVAVLVVTLAGARNSGRGWVLCGAAAHSGFAAIEGILGALGNEGMLKVVVGRSLGALTHCSWGIIMTWLLWRGWTQHGSRWGNWIAALLVPVLLHAVINASGVEVPGATNLPADAPPPPAAILIMLSGMGALVASAALAVAMLIQARRVDENFSGYQNESLSGRREEALSTA